MYVKWDVLHENVITRVGSKFRTIEQFRRERCMHRCDAGIHEFDGTRRIPSTVRARPK